MSDIKADAEPLGVDEYRNVALVSRIGFSVCVIFSAVLAAMNDLRGALVVAVAGVAIALGPLIARVLKRPDVALNVLAAVTFSALVVQIYRQGGLDSPTAPWLLTIPLFLITCRCYHSAIGWLIAISAATGVILWAEHLALLPDAFPVQSPDLFRALVLLGLNGACAALIAIIVYERSRALRDLSYRNLEITYAQRSLAATKALLAQTLNALPQPVAVRDENGRYVLVNEAYCALYGGSAEQVLGKTPDVLFAPNDAAAIFARDADSRMVGHAIEFERSVRDHAGNEHWIVTNRQVMTLPDSTSLVLSVDQDLTQRRRMELELREATMAANAANHAKSEFLAKMSHEIRTPMNGVLGMAELLENSALLPTQRSYLDAIRASAESLLTIINDILDFSRIEAGKVRLETIPFNLKTTLAQTTTLIERAADKKGVKLVLELPAELPHVKGDPLRLKQIVLNLLGNAVKFTEHGQVTLRTVVLSREAAYCRIRIEVRDTGIGISPAQQLRLFDAFTQADDSTTRRFGGSGLGLAIARQLTELMGGQIGVESRPGSGSRFWLEIELPLATATTPKTSLPSESIAGTGRRVLVVEDNTVNLTIALAMLAEAGFATASANNGREAVDAVSRSTYDLVLMDCQMPEMDGLAATQAIRTLEKQRPLSRHGLRLPVVALTASAFAEDRERCQAAGMDDFLAKPFTRAELLAVLSRWCEEPSSVTAAA